MSRKSLLLAASVGLVAGLVASSLYLTRDPLPHYLERRSAIASVNAGEPEVVGGSQLQTVRLAATNGLAVELMVRRQVSDSSRRLPMVVILGGHVTGASAARLVGETPGVIVTAVSYPFSGDPRPSKTTFVREIPKIRAAFLDTPPALMLALDYLLARPDVDARRVEGVGVSLGAPFITIAGALDTRFTRIWAIHGSGGTYVPLESNMRRTIGFKPARVLAAGVATVLIGGPRIAAERWVSRIAPRPFIMVNATDDERVPRSAVDALYERAGHPKEQIWMSGGHVHGDAPTIRRLVEIVLTRVNAASSAREVPSAF